MPCAGSAYASRHNSKAGGPGPALWSLHPNPAAPDPLLLLQVIDFYEYYEGLQEGWDGPALLVFCDGNKVGARLDRNGLRPARYWETKDGMVYVASEVGVLGDVLSNASNIVRKGRLGPGQMVCADLDEVCHAPPSLLTFCQVSALFLHIYAHSPLPCCGPSMHSCCSLGMGTYKQLELHLSGYAICRAPSRSMLRLHGMWPRQLLTRSG